MNHTNTSMATPTSQRFNRIEIKQETCIGCGICQEECPASVIEITNGKAVTKTVNNCILCGHCALICPTESIHPSPYIKKYFKISPPPTTANPIHKLLATKRSARLFNNQPLSPKIIKEIINHAEYAPSAKNVRQRRYLVISSPKETRQLTETVIKAYQKILYLLNPVIISLLALINRKQYLQLKKMTKHLKELVNSFKNGNDPIFRNAPTIILIFAPSQELFSRDDCIAAQHYGMLYAHSIKIDSFIVGYAQWAHKKIETKFKIPQGYSIYAISAFGYGKRNFEKVIDYEMPEIRWNI